MNLQERLEYRTKVIVENSMNAASSEGVPEQLWTEDGDIMWFSFDSTSRAKATQTYIDETDPSLDEEDVTCEKVWMRIDHDTIREHARDLARDVDDEDVESTVAWTWEDGSFRWVQCKHTDEGAAPFWRVEA